MAETTSPTPEDAQNWFVGTADIKSPSHQIRIPGWLQASFALPAALAFEVGYTGKTVERRRIAPDSVEKLPTRHFQWVFSWAMFFCQDITDHCTLAEKCGFSSLRLLPPLRTTTARQQTRHGIRWWYADNFGVLARGANCANVHLARLIAVVQKTGPDVHDTSRANGSVMKCLQPTHCSGTERLI